MNIIVIPSDNFIIVDNVAYTDFPDFTFDLSVHAIHWNEVSGSIEFEEKGKPNLKIFGEADFDRWVRPYYEAWQAADTLEKETYNSPEAIAIREIETKKQERIKSVDAITVTVDDLIFDGDEESQARMARTIQAAEYNGNKEFQWIMADNSVRNVTLDQLKEAFGKAVSVQNEMWYNIRT